MERIAKHKRIGCEEMVLKALPIIPICLLPFGSVRAESINVVNVVSVHTPLCMDVAYESRKSGAVLGRWPCHSGANQQLQFMAKGEIRVYGNKCVDPLGGKGTRGDRIGIWDLPVGAHGSRL